MSSQEQQVPDASINNANPIDQPTYYYAGETPGVQMYAVGGATTAYTAVDENGRPVGRAGQPPVLATGTYTNTTTPTVVAHATVVNR